MTVKTRIYVSCLLLLSIFLEASIIARAGVAASGIGDDTKPVFQFAVFMNEEFKQSELDLDCQKRIRHILEAYHELVLMPHFRYAIQYLSKNDDRPLMGELIKVLISYENAADEELSFGLANLFLANPKLVESAYNKISFEEKRIIYRRLREGSMNVSPRLSPSRRMEFKNRISALNPSP